VPAAARAARPGDSDSSRRRPGPDGESPLADSLACHGDSELPPAWPGPERPRHPSHRRVCQAARLARDSDSNRPFRVRTAVQVQVTNLPSCSAVTVTVTVPPSAAVPEPVTARWVVLRLGPIITESSESQWAGSRARARRGASPVYRVRVMVRSRPALRDTLSTEPRRPGRARPAAGPGTQLAAGGPMASLALAGPLWHREIHKLSDSGLKVLGTPWHAQA
jgi:hypothetical protein